MTRIAFYGSSILSSYWNGAATYYRGIVRALARRGYDVAFFEPDAFERQERRDIDPPDWCTSVVFSPTHSGVAEATARAAEADIVVKASGVGVHDDELLDQVMRAARPDAVRIWWDVDAPATLAAIRADADLPLRHLLPQLDLVLTYGGGDEVVAQYLDLGARECVPIYNALDATTHYPVASDSRYAADLAFLGNRLPDREERVHSFFLSPAASLPDRRFLLGGAGWHDMAMPGNVVAIGHVPTANHNAFNATPLAVLNINRDSMAACGFSPATRIFEAAGAGACIITDEWPGIDTFLAPGREVLVARDGDDVAEILQTLTPGRAQRVGDAARARIAAQHTYTHRAGTLDALFRQALARKRQEAA